MSGCFPPYSGPFEVGVTDIEWAKCFSEDIREQVDFPKTFPKPCPEELMNDCDSLLVRIHYPSTVKDEHLEEKGRRGSEDSSAPLKAHDWDRYHRERPRDESKVYWLPERRYAKGYGVIAGVPPWVGRIVGYITLRNVTLPVTWNGPLLGEHHHHGPNDLTAPEPTTNGSSSSSSVNINLHAESDSNLPRFPVIIFSHGLSSCRTTLSTLCGEMASYGNIVFAIEHRDGSACFTVMNKGSQNERELLYERPPLEGLLPNAPFRNNQYRHRVQEVLKTMELIHLLEHNRSSLIKNLYPSLPLSAFASRMNLSRLALTGHSAGGGTVLETLARHSEIAFDLAVTMDPWGTPLTIPGLPCLDSSKDPYPHAGDYKYSTTPTLFINSGSFHWPDNLRQVHPYVHGPDDTKSRIDNPWYQLTPAAHQSFSDAGLLPVFHRLSFVKWFAVKYLRFPDLRLEEAAYRVWVFANQTRRYLRAQRVGSTIADEQTIVPDLIEDRVSMVQHRGATVDESLLSKDDCIRFKDIEYGFPMDRLKHGHKASQAPSLMEMALGSDVGKPKDE